MVKVRQSKQNPDIWRVYDGNDLKGKHQSNSAAQAQAKAIRKVKKKRAARKAK